MLRQNEALFSHDALDGRRRCHGRSETMPWTVGDDALDGRRRCLGRSETMPLTVNGNYAVGFTNIFFAILFLFCTFAFVF